MNYSWLYLHLILILDTWRRIVTKSTNQISSWFFLIFFYLFIKCMQSKAMTLFILKRFSFSNTFFFTPLTMYFYEILFCSLISWVNCTNKLGFNLILLTFYSFSFSSSFSSISLTFFHSPFCYHKSKSTRPSCHFLVATRVFWIYLTKLTSASPTLWTW